MANVVLAVSALGVATLIVVTIGRRHAWRPEPLGVVFCLVFLAIGVRAAVAVWSGSSVAVSPAQVIFDWLAAAAAVAFLTLHGRYGVLIDNAEMVRGYAEKDREARALAQVNEELRRLDELKSEFLAMVSHELRTPLTAIVGYSRLLLRQAHGTLTPKQLEHQEAIFRGAQRLNDLINDLLDVSRLEAGRIELTPRSLDLHQVVEQVGTVVTAAAQARRIHVRTMLPPFVTLETVTDCLLTATWSGGGPAAKRPGATMRMSSETMFFPTGGLLFIAGRPDGGRRATSPLPEDR